MSDTRRDQQDWVKAIAAHLGVSPSELARRSRIAPSTLNRFLNDPNYAGLLSAQTVASIADAVGLKPLEFPGRHTGFSEAEAEPYREPEDANALDGSARAIKELCRGRNGRDPWTIRTAVLDMAGIMPGDVVIVDLSKRAKAGDLVCAQVYDWRAGRADTIMRMYDPPFLVSQSHTLPSAKPLMVDDDSVVIKGVIDAVIRVRN